MKIISWDIGINNLAYCIMEDYKIIKWDKIDILEDIRPQEYICEGLLKNNTNCNKKASYYINNSIDNTNNRIYYCKTHGKKVENLYKILKHELCECLNKNNKNCSYKASYYSDNKKFYCNKHKYLSETELKKYITADNISFFNRSQFLFQKLSNLNDILDVDEVVIENQPVHKNPVMKSIQILLYAYYSLNTKNRINEIHLLNATQKMKVYDGPKIDCQIKDTHERNKYLAKEHCKYFLKDDNEMLAYYNSYDKKDDLADTYLQGIYFIKKYSC